jgi:hypothetical protein
MPPYTVKAKPIMEPGKKERFIGFMDSLRIVKIYTLSPKPEKPKPIIKPEKRL